MVTDAVSDGCFSKGLLPPFYVTRDVVFEVNQKQLWHCVDFEGSCTVRPDVWFRFSNLVAPWWCPLIWGSDQFWPGRFLSMRDLFGPRGAFHSYQWIYVLIKSRGYRLSMIPFILASEYCWGQCFEHLVFFEFLMKQNLETKKQDCMQTYLFLAIDNSGRQLS